MPTQQEKSTRFRALHQRDHAFIIPNPWDPGSARMLQSLGFEALATTSAGYAFSIGKADGAVGRDKMLQHAAAIVSSTDLPVSADLENCYGDAPALVAETVRLAAQTGLAGCSVEDVPAGRNAAPYEMSLAKERVTAAAEAAHAQPFPFTLTARAENFVIGRPDLRDTIARLQAFQEAGADVLFAPGVKTKEEITAVVSSVDRPVNFLALPGARWTLSQLSALGVKRISVGSGLARVAIGAFLGAANEMRAHGTFTFSEQAIKSPDIVALFGA
jgi:2-methylisocitrate lyase-like PEP mutase family enzyme